MTFIGYALLILGILLAMTAVLMAIQIGRGRMVESIQVTSGQWGSKSFSAGAFTGLLLLFSGCMIALGYFTVQSNAKTSTATAEPIAAEAPVTSTVTITSTPTMTPNGAPSLQGGSATTSTPQTQVSGTHASGTTSSQPPKTGPWTGSNNNLHLVVERLHTDRERPTVPVINLRAMNNSGQFANFDLDSFLAIDNFGYSYTADKDISSWKGSYLAPGQRTAGSISLSAPLQPGTTALAISFNVSSGIGYETVTATIPAH